MTQTADAEAARASAQKKPKQGKRQLAEGEGPLGAAEPRGDTGPDGAAGGDGGEPDGQHEGDGKLVAEGEGEKLADQDHLRDEGGDARDEDGDEKAGGEAGAELGGRSGGHDQMPGIACRQNPHRPCFTWLARIRRF